MKCVSVWGQESSGVGGLSPECDRNRRGPGGGGSDSKCIVSGQNAEVLQGYEVSGEKYSSFSYKVLLYSRVSHFRGYQISVK